MSKPVPIDQWADVLIRHVDAELCTSVTNAMATYRQANVPRRYLYAALRDFLLNSASDKHHPMIYLDRMNSIKQGEFEADIDSETKETLLLFTKRLESEPCSALKNIFK